MDCYTLKRVKSVKNLEHRASAEIYWFFQVLLLRPPSLLFIRASIQCCLVPYLLWWDGLCNGDTFLMVIQWYGGFDRTNNVLCISSPFLLFRIWCSHSIICVLHNFTSNQFRNNLGSGPQKVKQLSRLRYHLLCCLCIFHCFLGKCVEIHVIKQFETKSR